MSLIRPGMALSSTLWSALIIPVLEHLAWAKCQRDISRQVVWKYGSPIPWAPTVTGRMAQVKVLYLSPRDPNVTYDPSVQSFATYNFHPCDFTVLPQPCDPSVPHHAFIPVLKSAGANVKGMDPTFLDRSQDMDPSPWTISSNPPPFNLEEIATFLSGSHLWDAGTWGKVRLLGLELQALSTMLMKWPTENWLMGTFMELDLLSSDLADVHDELWHPGPPVWFISIDHLYYTNNSDERSHDDQEARCNPERSAALGAAAQDGTSPGASHHSAFYSHLNPYFGMRNIHDEVGSPQWALKLWRMIFDTMHPGFTGNTMWNEVYICLANLLHLPSEYDRPSVLSLRQVADDQVLLMPKWCAMIPRSLKKVIMWHLAEADAVLFYNLRYQSEPPSRSVSPSAPPNYCPPPVLESPPPTKLPLPPIVDIDPSMAKSFSAQVSMTDEDPMPPPIPAAIAAGVQPSEALVPSETPGTMDIDPAVPPISGVAAEMEPSEMLVPSQTSGAMDIDPAIPSTPTIDAVVRSTETLGPSETFGTIGVDSTVPANPTIPITANPP
ncbi:hypothetical protein BS47DRAFT_1361999 [Hydnum rufescens UP504]|uniref:Uncharacterized protein n=1 Tax=Hydnum rufescens UP504 TaxID=1448309 RepID=A0A9P6DWW0_9AGAM|nr:hypothetical protein BS47DRAFT_1361999 [Hydnum rufescens UP504]